MNRTSSLLIASLLLPLALSACYKTESVPPPPVIVPVPGPAGPTGATGGTGTEGQPGATGTQGATGRPGDSTTVIVMPPAASAPSN